eukprot:SAG11_NODE_20_length_25330_cov_18.348143_12_plen_68_part_00
MLTVNALGFHALRCHSAEQLANHPLATAIVNTALGEGLVLSKDVSLITAYTPVYFRSGTFKGEALDC